MVAEWIAPLAASGSGALIAAAATDAWQSARDGVLALFGRAGHRRQELAAGWLDDDAEAVEAVEPTERDRVREGLVPVWRVRLADLLAEYPEAGDELRSWAARVRDALPQEQRSWVQNNTARDGGTVFAVQGGTQHIHQGMPRDRSEGGAGDAGES
jgi:hypothetical protein